MGDFFKSIYFKIILGLAVLVTAFMIRAAYTGGLATIGEQLMVMVTQPFAKISSSLSYFSGNYIGSFFRAGEINRENEDLKQQIQDLQNRMVDYDTLQNENKQLRAFLNIQGENTGMTTLLATVIGRDTGGKYYSFTINRGSLNGVKLYDPVITADGFVGTVAELGATYAKVKTLFDPSLEIAAFNPRTQDTCLASGDLALSGQGSVKVDYLPRDGLTEKGDIIITAGVSDLIPSGVIIGTVQKVMSDEQGTYLYASVIPAANPKTVKNVMVVTDFVGKGSE